MTLKVTMYILAKMPKNMNQKVNVAKFTVLSNRKVSCSCSHVPSPNLYNTEVNTDN